jgi:type IV pilus assembly protein PilE
MKRTKGFSLMELMIVVIIIGVLLSISLPAYQGYVQRSHRTDAHSSLLDIAARQERHVAQFNRYADVITASDLTGLNLGSANSKDGYYTLAAAACAGGAIANCYLITATAAGSQANDAGCTAITYDSAGAKAPAACW